MLAERCSATAELTPRLHDQKFPLHVSVQIAPEGNLRRFPIRSRWLREVQSHGLPWFKMIGLVSLALSRLSSQHHRPPS